MLPPSPETMGTAPPNANASAANGSLPWFATGKQRWVGSALIAVGFVASALSSPSVAAFPILFGGWLTLLATSWRNRVALSLFAAAFLMILGLRIEEALTKHKLQQLQTANVIEIEAALDTAIAAKDLQRISTFEQQLRQVRPNHPRIQELSSLLSAEQTKTQAANTETARRQSVRAGITDARAIVQDESRCKEPQQVAIAWSKLRLVAKTDTEWTEALQVIPPLEVCRRKAEKAASAALRAVMVGQRERWAEQAELSMLDQGMNVEIIIGDSAKDRVTLQWALMSRAAAHKITNGGDMNDGSFLPTLQKLGFRRVTFSDGYNESWSYTLDPPDEADAGKIVLAGMGIGEALMLK
ncbi:MAG TPA: hypothetical protein VNJ02_11460 [Vicinamibacterales bacterium]|nr:hypothetical protein [Vicinamibacterales bacterium]